MKLAQYTKLMIGCVICGAAIAVATIAPIFANPSPPTNGGNGAGQSGQCTGAAADRPNSCQSPNGAGSNGNGG